MINLNWRNFISFIHKLYLYCRGEKCMSSLIKLSNIFKLMQIIIALAIKTCNTGQGSFSAVGLQGV